MSSLTSRNAVSDETIDLTAIEVTRELAEFALDTTLDGIPETVRELGKRSMLDGIGLAIAGSVSDVASISATMIEGYGRLNTESTVLGTGSKLPARFSAFLNGVAIHADDYDDTQLAVRPDRVYGLLTHPTAPVLPASLALVERQGGSGRDLLLGYSIGVEAATKLAEAINPRHYDDGFHATATLGSIGSAAGAARVFGLDLARTRIALGLAATQAAGLRENFGTMTKPFHAGRAAEAAIVAIELAGSGMTAASNVIEAKRGFFSAAGGGYDPSAIHDALGRPWSFESPGVSIKPHPSGSLTHPGMGAMLELILAEDIRPEHVSRVVVGTNRHMPNALIHHRPVTELNAKFSMEFCMAILLLERRAGLAEFTDEVVNRPDVRAMIEKVDFGVAPEAEAAGYNNMTTIITVELDDGRVLRTEAAFGKGSPQKPMSDDELIGKFADCLAWGGVRTDPERIARRILAIEDEPSIPALLSELVVP
jgi:2-methylcitrate dehydratase PrpD